MRIAKEIDDEPTVAEVQVWLDRLRRSDERQGFLMAILAFGCITLPLILLFPMVSGIRNAWPRLAERRRKQLERLCRIRSPRAIPLLLLALGYVKQEDIGLVRSALTRLMSRLTESDGIPLGPAWWRLKEELIWAHDYAQFDGCRGYTLAILHAIEVTKAASCRDFVVYAFQLHRRDQQIVVAARECLSVLDRYIQQSRDNKSLLRPTTQADDSLLRPTTDISQPFEQLLRPDLSESSSPE